MNYQQVKQRVLEKIEITWLEKMNLFDLYQGASLPSGKKSVGLSFVFRAQDRTLTDGDINPVMDAIIRELAVTDQISLRD